MAETPYQEQESCRTAGSGRIVKSDPGKTGPENRIAVENPIRMHEVPVFSTGAFFRIALAGCVLRGRINRDLELGKKFLRGNRARVVEIHFTMNPVHHELPLFRIRPDPAP